MIRPAAPAVPLHRSRGAATEKRVLDAAFRLISLHGIHAVTMLDISREAGVAEKTVYNIFGSKVGLSSRLVEMYQSNLRADFRLSDTPDMAEIVASMRQVALGLASNPRWSEAIAALYFSLTVDEATHRQLRAIGLRHLDAAVELLRRQGTPVDNEDLAMARHQFANLGYALVHDLALGRIDGAELERQLCYGLDAALGALTSRPA